jgi:hypothetical protein
MSTGEELRENREKAREEAKKKRGNRRAITQPQIIPDNRSNIDRIVEWSKRKYKAEKSSNFRRTPCMICKQKTIKPEGKGTFFLRNEEGSYLYRCGGLDGKGTLEGRLHGDVVLKVPLLMDRNTLKQEIRPTQQETIRELKKVRDMVLARNTIDEEDKERFETLEGMSRNLTKIEESYIEAIHTKPPEIYTYIYEEDPVNDLLKEPRFNTRQIRGQDGKVMEELRPIVFGVVYPEEIPVSLRS